MNLAESSSGRVSRGRSLRGLPFAVCPLVLLTLTTFLAAPAAQAQTESRCERHLTTVTLPQTVLTDESYRLRFAVRDLVIYMRPEDYLAIVRESEFYADEPSANLLTEALAFEGVRSLTETAIWPADGRFHPLLFRFVADLVEMGKAGIVDGDGALLPAVEVELSDGPWDCGRHRNFRALGSGTVLFGVVDRFD